MCAILLEVLLLFALPGLPLLLLVRRDVRRRLNLTRNDRVTIPANGWRTMCGCKRWVGPCVSFGLLIGWPFVLARRRAVTDFFVRRPWLILRTD